MTALGQSSTVPPLILNFTAYAINPPVEEIVYLPKPKRAVKPIQFYSSAKTPAQKYNGPNPVTFFNEKPATDSTQPPIRTILARAFVPDGVTEPLFIFFPNLEFGKIADALPYHIYVFDEGAEKLPAGHIALINASGLDLVGRFNTEIIELSQGSYGPLKVGKNARIELRTLVRGKYYHSYQSILQFNSNERALLLLMPPNHPGSIEAQVRILRSEIESEPAE